MPVTAFFIVSVPACRHEAAVTEFMKSRRRTTTNAFGNLVAELDSVVDFVRSKDGSAELITASGKEAKASVVASPAVVNAPSEHL